MSGELVSQAGQPGACCAYEVTEELMAGAALALFEARTRRPRAPHPLLHACLIGVVWFQLSAALVIAFVWFGPSLPMLILVPVGTFVLLLLLLRIALYALPAVLRWYVRRRAVRGVRCLEDRHVRWTFHGDRFETQSALNQRKIAWTDVTGVRAVREFWILTLASGPVLFFPDTALLPEARALLERQARELATTGGRQTMNPRDNPFADDDPGSGGSPFGTHDQVVCCKCGGSVPREDATFKVKTGPNWWSILFWGPIWSMILRDDQQHRGYYCPLCLRLFQQAEQRRKVYCAVACVVIVVVIILLEFIH